MKTFAALSFVIIAALGCGSSTDAPPSIDTDAQAAELHAPPAGAILVTASNYAFAPSTLTLKVGERATLFVTNESPDVDHDMQSDLPIRDLSYAHADNDPSEMASNTRENKLDIDFHAGGWAQVSFTPTKAGTYAFHCGEADHADKGMVGRFVVAP